MDVHNLLISVSSRVASDAFVEGATLSLIEKYLLKKGWRIENHCDPYTMRVSVKACSPEGALFEYPHPAYDYAGQERPADTRAALERLADILSGQGGAASAESLALEVAACLDVPMKGFSCRQCGECCNRMADAYQGRVSPEEVHAWERLGLKRILRFVQKVERPGYALYKAWVHPVTGRYLSRCPWLSRPLPDSDGGTRRICRIHAYRPLKCRCFPLHQEHAEYARCRGLLPLQETSCALDQD